MEKMQATAKKLDTFFRVIQVFFSVGMVCALVGLGIIGAFFVFDLTPEQVATGYDVLELGCLELVMAADVVPDAARILTIKALELVMVFAFLVMCWVGMRCVRRILAPMQKGLPFQETVVVNLKKLALFSLILGVIINVMEGIEMALTARCYDLCGLLLSDKVTGVSVNYEIDLSFLVVGAVLLLLSYVFRYGVQLQKLSDETL